MITHPQSIPAGALSMGQITRHLQGKATCNYTGCGKNISGNKLYCREHAEEMVPVLRDSNTATLKDRLERHHAMEETTTKINALKRTAR